MNVSCVIVRPFEDSDLEACAGLFTETFARPPWNETWDPEVVSARLEQIVRTPHFLGLVLIAQPDLITSNGDAEGQGGDPDGREGELLGFALGFAEPWHEGSHFYLKEMCVHPDHQRQGLGSRLMTELMARTQERGSSRIYLLTTRGEAAEQFYTRAGFYTSPKMILMARRFSTESATL